MERNIISFETTKTQIEALAEIQKRTGLTRSILIRQAINMVLGVYGHDKDSQEHPLDQVAH